MANQIDLNDIYIFYWVSELKSITAASEKLNTSKQTISRKLAQLEQSLGVTLVARNTRCFKLTYAGVEYFKNCLTIIELIEQANAMVRQHQKTPEGIIRIRLPYEFNCDTVCSLFMKFMQDNPGIKLHISLCDKNTFSISDGFDLTFKLGDLEDSSLVARQLGTVNYALLASGRYLKKVGLPRTCEDLLNHTYISVSKNNEMNENISPLLSCRQLVVNEMVLAKQFSTQGFGLARLPLFICQEELKSGALVVLPIESCMESKPLHLIFLKNKFVPGYVRKFVDYFVSAYREQNPWNIDYHNYLYLEQRVEADTRPQLAAV